MGIDAFHTHALFQTHAELAGWYSAPLAHAAEMAVGQAARLYADSDPDFSHIAKLHLELTAQDVAWTMDLDASIRQWLDTLQAGLMSSEKLSEGEILRSPRPIYEVGLDGPRVHQGLSARVMEIISRVEVAAKEYVAGVHDVKAGAQLLQVMAAAQTEAEALLVAEASPKG
jgi:hypothetical protein